MSTESELAQAALELVLEFGGTGLYKNFVQGPYVPGQNPVDTEVVQPVKIALVELTLQSNGTSVKWGTEVLAGDKEAYLIPPERYGGTPIRISPNVDKIVFGGIEYNVITSKETNLTGSTPLVYQLYLRR